jgi:hypothetical protein
VYLQAGSVLILYGGIILKRFFETGYKDVAWIKLAEDRHQWWAFVNTVMNQWVLQKGEEFPDWPEQLLAPEEGLGSMQLVGGLSPVIQQHG